MLAVSINTAVKVCYAAYMLFKDYSKGIEHVLHLKQLVHQIGLLEHSRRSNMYVAF